MTDVTINTGTTMGLSATLPATFDSAGYVALTYTDIGEIVDIGELAKAYATIAHQSVTRAYPQKLKDTYDIANVTLTLGRVPANTGQVALQTALAAAASYAFKILLPSGDIGYFTGKVIKAGVGGIASGAVTSTMVEIAIDPESLIEVV
jgi:hypothetical protein